MNIIIKRCRLKPETIDGQLYIEGLKVCDTAENAKFRIPPGTYIIKLLHHQTWGRKMPTLVPGFRSMGKGWSEAVIGMGNGVYHRKDGSIIVGEYIVPGCLKHSKHAFDALYERIRKSIARGNQVTLTIKDSLS